MSDYDYDLFVIGGGSGGVRAARVSAAQGKKVALAENSRMGGTCVIRGCVPKKLMVFASEYRDMPKSARSYGWDIQDGTFDWPTFRGRLHEELDRLEQVYRKLLNGSGVDIYDARATLKDRHTILIDGEKEVTAEIILIASGGHPVRPDLPNADLGIVSDDIFNLDALPKSMLIIGGGYIACEMACILNGLGVEITLWNRRAGILRGFDEEARGLVAETMREQGIDMHFGTTIVEMAQAEGADHGPRGTGSDAAMGADVSQSAELLNLDSQGDNPVGGPIWVKGSNGQEKVFDQVFFATGRAPNTANMGLEEVGLKLGRRKEIVVDEYSKTEINNIFAIGDVTGRVELTPVAIREGMAFAKTLFENDPTPVDHELIPSAVFTQPELGTIGMTEEEAMEQEPCDIYCTSFRPMQSAFAGSPTRVLMKLVVAQESRKVLGCHIVAPNAGEMIQLAGVAIKMGATKEDFDRTVAVHPTMSEEIVTMKEPMRSA